MPQRVGIIGSSGGSALQAARACLLAAGFPLDLIVITDRDCGLGRWAVSQGYESVQLEYADAIQFSAHALKVLKSYGCQHVLLFYTRRVAAPLINHVTVYNIHPSLLPSFPGLHAVAQALSAGAKLLGSTLHRVDEGLDTGEILAQVACPLPHNISLADAQRLSYIQKVWLTLVWFESISGISETSAPKIQCSGSAIGTSSAHLKNSALNAAYLKWQGLSESNSE